MAVKITDITKVYVITLKRFENRAVEIKAILRQRFGQFFYLERSNHAIFVLPHRWAYSNPACSELNNQKLTF